MDSFSHRKAPYYYVIGGLSVDKKSRAEHLFQDMPLSTKAFAFQL